MPVILRGGFKSQHSEAVKQYATAKLDSGFEMTHKTKYAIDKNWSVGVKQSFDSNKLDSKPYDIGFSMTYKLWAKDKWSWTFSRLRPNRVKDRSASLYNQLRYI